MNNTRDIQKNNPDKQQKRSTIGVLIDYARPMTAGGYQSILWAGISDCAKRQDVNLICFSGRALKEPYEFEMQRNVIYGLVDPTNADALILCGGLGNFVSPDEYQRFCERFYPLPIVSIAFSVKGAANVLVDNEKGLREAVAHFVEVHDKTKFAFIRGSRDNLEAEMRFDIFKQVLQDYHLELPDAFIAQGDFLPHTGAEAVQFFFDTQDFLPGEDIQVIFAANDGMALGALEALRERRITVPQDITLVGFDDIPEASLVSPKLTTVRQPLYEQGQRAVQIALDLLNGQLHPEPVILQTEFVARQSCGCLPRNVEHVTESMMSYPIPKSSEDKIPDQSRNELQRKISEIFDQVSPKDVSRLAGELLDNFIAEIKGTPSGRFVIPNGEGIPPNYGIRPFRFCIDAHCRIFSMIVWHCPARTYCCSRHGYTSER
jgi:DNA-binding LacI/PurR family transcriptional regulator